METRTKINKLYLAFTFLFFITLNYSQTKINIEYVKGFSKEEKKLIESKIHLLENLINSKKFEKSILKPRKKYLRTKIKAYNKKFNNKEILELIRNGKELNTEKDNIINLKIRLYDTEKNEIGNTNLQTLVISTHRGYFKNNSIEKYFSHLLHEYCHVIGFRHAVLRMPFRSRTVPYAVGKSALNLLKKD